MSGKLPSAVIFTNDNLTENIKLRLMKQLFIDGYMDGYTFDQYIDGYSDSYINNGYIDGYQDAYEDSLDGYNFPLTTNLYTYIHQHNKRLLVFRPFNTINNRQYADALIYVKNGLAAVELCKVGPPAITYPVINLTLQKIGLF